MESRTEYLLTLPEVAVRLGVCVATVRCMFDRNSLPAKRVGRQYRVPAAAFDLWFEQVDAQPP